MRALVRRYITNEQRTAERQRGVTEDDCNEIKQDISALRFELIELLGGRSSSINPLLNPGGLVNVMGKRGRKRERRLMKGFDFNFLFMDATTSFDEPDIPAPNGDQKSVTKSDKSALAKSPPAGAKNRFARLARGLAGNKKAGGRTNKWRQLIEATRSRVIPFSRSSESVNSVGQQIPTSGASAQKTSIRSSLEAKSDLVDASIKRSLFAKRRSTSLLPEESQSQDVDDDHHPPAPPILHEVKKDDDRHQHQPPATSVQTTPFDLKPDAPPKLIVTLPVPILPKIGSSERDSSSSPDPKDRSREEREGSSPRNLKSDGDHHHAVSSRSPSRSPSKSPSPATLSTQSVLIGLTQVSRSRNEWI